MKATGFGRIGVSGLPSTRAAIPFQDSDIERIADAVGADHVDTVLATNARDLYRL
ncbi:hypothetical protein [Mycolicibacterium aromaticivorans]|uniref:hypothetical protein n=1 Tax=Mycolicibacterium aromaticivorans TaxID=318425 RepID=UPI00044BFA43|nr:hypothetical protein [Mycolicibacterium aromaticivorans]